MAVIINDFEIVLDAPASSVQAPSTGGSAEPGGAPPPGQRPISPLDIMQIQHHLDQRRNRLRAH